MKTSNIAKSGAFTLIELLTVISIMAILATVSFPAIKMAMISGQMARATADAKSISLGLRGWAGDNDGVYPVGETEDGEEITTSNDAFRLLVDDYIDSERIFENGRSAWGRSADGRIDEMDEILEAGENHYSYIAGLTTTSRSNWPLVVDGTNGSAGYVSQQGSKGGCWEGRKVIVAYVGGHAAAVKLRGDDEERYLPREGYPEENALEVGAYMGDTAVLLDPEEG